MRARKPERRRQPRRFCLEVPVIYVTRPYSSTRGLREIEYLVFTLYYEQDVQSV